MADFSFEIEEQLLVLSENEKGWTKELNRVSFNGAPAKYDIRTWSQMCIRDSRCTECHDCSKYWPLGQFC